MQASAALLSMIKGAGWQPVTDLNVLGPLVKRAHVVVYQAKEIRVGGLLDAGHCSASEAVTTTGGALAPLLGAPTANERKAKRVIKAKAPNAVRVAYLPIHG